jgi:hypothetical protein
MEYGIRMNMVAYFVGASGFSKSKKLKVMPCAGSHQVLQHCHGRLGVLEDAKTDIAHPQA